MATVRFNEVVDYEGDEKDGGQGKEGGNVNNNSTEMLEKWPTSISTVCFRFLRVCV